MSGVTVRVQEEAFKPGAELDAFVAAGDAGEGAVASFAGLVRDLHPQGDGAKPALKALTLEHYPGMTERQLERIAADAMARFPLSRCLVIHRYGRMGPREPIVLVCTASAHRQAALDACAFLMDWLKTQAPFWKLEETDAGTGWVEAKVSDDAAADKWR